MNAKTTPLRAAIYARQSVKEDEGVKQQVKHCRVVAEAVHGWEVVGEYCDNATSASKSREEGTRWAAMLADFDAGLFDVVVCVSVDRLLRRVVDVVELREPKRPRDVRIVTARDGIDTGGSMGRTVLTILVALAEGEIENKKARMIPYATARRAEGHPWPGRVPYGYRWIPESQRLPDKHGPRWRVDSDEKAVVKRIFHEFLAGPNVKLGGIARDLNADGLRTRPPKPRAGDEAQPGGLWGTTSIRRILLSPFYAGLLPKVQGWADFDAARVVIEECAPGAWESIIEEEHYLAARSKLLDDTRRKHNGNSRRWLLSGLARCDRCGVAIRSARTREGYHGYRCPAGHFLRRGDIIDQYVEHVVIERLSADDALDLLTPPKSGPDLAVLMAQRAALEGRDSAIASMVADGAMRPEAAREALAGLSVELQSVNGAIASAVNFDPLADIATADDVRAVWERLTLERRRAVVEALCVPLVRSIGKGRTATTLGEAEATVAIVWRKPGRSNVALPALVNEAAGLFDPELADVRGPLTPDLSEGVRAALAALLN